MDPKKDSVQVAWSRPLTAPVAGLSLARERGRLLAWDQDNWIHLLDGHGNAHAQHQVPELAAACAADDGSAYAAVSSSGGVWWLAPDMMARWEKKLPGALLAAALDAHGQYLAASDNQGRIHIFDRLGQTVNGLLLPRPVHHLAFVPAAGFLVGCAEYGLVTAFNLTGNVLWDDRPMSRVGGISVDGEGKQILLASFSDGIHRYDERGKKTGSFQIAQACRLAAQSYCGDRILASGLSKQVFILDRECKTLADISLKKTPVALAVAALGHDAYAGLENGDVVKLSVAVEL